MDESHALSIFGTRTGLGAIIWATGFPKINLFPKIPAYLGTHFPSAVYILAAPFNTPFDKLRATQAATSLGGWLPDPPGKGMPGLSNFRSCWAGQRPLLSVGPVELPKIRQVQSIIV